MKNQEPGYLNNKNWRPAQRIRSAAKSKRCFGGGKKIRDCPVGGKYAKAENLRCNKIAKTEFARETMVKIVVLVRDLRLAGVVRMLAVFLGKFGNNMLEGMHRLEQD